MNTSLSSVLACSVVLNALDSQEISCSTIDTAAANCLRRSIGLQERRGHVVFQLKKRVTPRDKQCVQYIYIKMTQSDSQSMSSSEGIEYELMDFLLMSTQDELNAANALQSELDANARFMNLFADDSPRPSAARQPSSGRFREEEEDVTEDVIDGTLSASSFVAGWINQPTGCPAPSKEYGRTHTDAVEQAEIERQLKLYQDGEEGVGDNSEIEGALSWNNVTDQILTGLGLRQKDGNKDNNSGGGAAVVFGLNTPLTDSSNSSSREGIADTRPTEGHEKARSKKSRGRKSKNNSAQDTTPNDARDDSDARRNDSNDGSERSGDSKNGVVIELVEKCLVSNNDGDYSKGKRRTRANLAGGIDSSSSIPQTVNVVSSDNSTRSGGSKNEVIKKLAAKCLVMNKKSNSSEKLERLPLEPDSHLLRAPRPEEAMVMKATRRSKRMPLFQELHRNDDASVSISNAYFRPESRDPPIGPEIIPCDPPETSSNNDSMQQEFLQSQNHMHPQSHPRPENMIHYPQHLHFKWHMDNTEETTQSLEDNNTLGLVIDTDAPIYYSQPPRPETPFSGTPRHTEERTSYNGRTTATPMNKLASPLPLSPNFTSPRSRLPLSPNFASPLSRHTNESSLVSRHAGSEDEKENNETCKEGVLLSPSAAVRRQHYKEMLLQERAAKKKSSI